MSLRAAYVRLAVAVVGRALEDLERPGVCLAAGGTPHRDRECDLGRRGCAADWLAEPRMSVMWLEAAGLDHDAVVSRLRHDGRLPRAA